jgi:hypothetical protein
MKWLKRWLFNAVREASHYEREELRHVKDVVVSTRGSSTQKSPLKRVELLQAVNGKIIEIMHRKSPHADWETTLYIVKDDEALADAIATALLVTGEN